MNGKSVFGLNTKTVASMNIPAVDILGVRVSAINMDLALSVIGDWMDKAQKHYVCVTGVHGVMESSKDPALRSIHNQSGLVTPDGMPLVWLSRLAGFRHVRRVYGPDLMGAVCEEFLDRHCRHFFYGGMPGGPEKLTERLRDRYPSLQVAGTYSPPFRPLTAEEDYWIVQHINSSRPDIVWVGISTPKQEYWMAEHVEKLSAPVLIGVGAAFDFNAGLKKQAPHWMQRSGTEWLFRLLTEPKRLWKRYLTNNPQFVYLMLRQFLSQGSVRKSSI